MDTLEIEIEKVKKEIDELQKKSEEEVSKWGYIELYTLQDLNRAKIKYDKLLEKRV